MGRRRQAYSARKQFSRESALTRSRKVAKRLVPEDVAALAARLHEQLEAERARIARRLHGDVAGMLAAARMDLSRLAGRVADEPELSEQVARVDRILETVIQHAREEMQRLHPALLDHFGLPAALRHLVEDACRAAGAEYTLDLPDLVDGSIGPADLPVYRVIERLLAGQPLRRVNVRLRETADGAILTLQVESDAAQDAAARQDLLALRAWLESIGARWSQSTRGEVEELELDLGLARRAGAPADELMGMRPT